MPRPSDRSEDGSDRRVTRRSLLRAGGLSVALFAGCSASSPGTTESPTPADVPTVSTREVAPTSTERRTTTRTEQPTTSEERTTTTEEFPPDVDERVTIQPPGSPALSPTGAWPQYRFDAGNTAYAPEPAGVRERAGHWVLDAGTTPAVRDGQLVNLFSHNLDTTRLTIRDPSTAAVEHAVDLVEYGVTGEVSLGPDVAYVSTFVRPFGVGLDGSLRWEGPELDGLMAPPTVADGDAYFAGTGYDPRNNPPSVARIGPDGTRRWKREFDVEPDGAVAASGGRVVVPVETGVVCLSAEDGSHRWESTGFQHGARVAVRDDSVVVVGGHSVAALDIADGSEVWRSSGDYAGLVVTGQQVVVGSTDGVRAFLIADGTEQWRTSGFGRPVAATGRTLYLAEERLGRTLVARSLDDGRRHWRYVTPEVQVSDVIEAGIYGVTPAGRALYVHAADGLHGIAGSA